MKTPFLTENTQAKDLLPLSPQEQAFIDYIDLSNHFKVRKTNLIHRMLDETGNFVQDELIKSTEEILGGKLLRFDTKNDEYFAYSREKFLTQGRHIYSLDLQFGDGQLTPFSVMPPSFVHCHYLRELRIYNGRFESFLHWPQKFPQLKNLYFSQCTFSSHSGFPTSFPKLQTLYFGDNMDPNQILAILSHLPKDLPSFTTIHFFQCHLSTILPQLFALLAQYPTLRTLSLDYCHLTSLPEAPNLYSHLKSISLSHNHLSSLEFLPSSLPLLEILGLNYNHFSSLESFPLSVPKLQYLAIEGNPYQSLFGLPKDLLQRLIHKDFQKGLRDRELYSYFPHTALNHLPPQVQDWIHAGDADKIFRYYQWPVSQVCHHLVHTKKISKDGLERLTFELTPDLRTYLDAHLSEDSPFRSQISLFPKIPSQTKGKPEKHHLLF